MTHWDDRGPIYQQLADQLATRLLDGQPPEGHPLPSVRALASQHLLNPMTVNRALQALAEIGIIESRRGLGYYVSTGARERLLTAERTRFLCDEWPRLRNQLQRLGIGAVQLQWESAT